MREFLLLANDNGLIAAAAVFAVLGLMLLCFLALQRGRYHAPKPGRRDDFAKMLILFQTMRDLLEEQKNLARELNEAIDTKVKFVKERVEAAQIDLANMRTEVQDLSRAIERHREHGIPERETTSLFDEDDLDAITPGPDRADRSPDERLRLLALPERDEEGADRLDAWVGLDLGTQPDMMTPDDLPEPNLDEPSDPELAREAFKSLLSQDPLPRIGRAEIASSDRPPAAPSSNGEGRITPAIKGRVFEYSSAGMTISQIAKELGIGKGEVRLILSLRDIQGS